jgi:hypothetical protein
VRAALFFAAALLLGGLLLVAGASSAPPLAQVCDGLETAACEGAVEAVRRRGLASVHPLILSVTVEPGTAPRPQDLGHRATLTYQMLGMPDTTVIELYYDQGAHWGGETDRSDTELAAWALAPLALAALLAAGLLALARRRPTV